MANFFGNSLPNTFTGTSTSDTMFGQGGNDLLSGSGGNDRLNGGVGNDTLNGGAGEDTADYSTGNFNGFNFQGALAGVGVTVNLSLTGAQSTGGGGIDTLVSIENVVGTSFNDALTGNSANNGLMGGSGNDILNGGSGDDWLVGGTGNDRLNGGAGIDTADYRNKIAAIGATAGVTVNLNLTGAQTTGGAGLDTLVGIENLTGTNFNDTLTGNGANNVLSGENGNDTLNGGNGNDTLQGGGNNDQLFGGSGNDLLAGGTGNDLLNGGAGSDTASYERATAGVTVGIGFFSDGEAQNTGGAGIDTLVDIESLTGSNFNDTLTGDHLTSDLNSTFEGGAGDDFIGLESSAAIVRGGEGNDHLLVDDFSGTLIGGAGRDTIEVLGFVFDSIAMVNGGAGADNIKLDGITTVLCDYNAVSDSPAGLGRDKIEGFQGIDQFDREDTIDLRDIDANQTSSASGNQAFIFGGPFTAGHLRYNTTTGVLQGNVDGDAEAEFEIQLVGAPALFVQAGNPASDILL